MRIGMASGYVQKSNAMEIVWVSRVGDCMDADNAIKATHHTTAVQRGAETTAKTATEAHRSCLPRT